MKKILKLTTLLLSMLCLFAIPVMANDEIVENYPFYLSFTGTIKEIEEVDDVITKVYVEDKENLPAYFMLNENTYYADNVKIEKGVEITGYYESNRPMILIYPPHYTIDIVTPVYEEGFVKADKFDSKLLSKDKQLKLNISENTEIVWENGTQVNWIKQPTVEELETVLSNRQMIVYYNFTTKSIPAQTTPTKIIVLSQQIEDKLSIIVDDVVIETPSAYINEAGNVMVPVRAISEALNYTVTWNQDEKSVNVGNDISLKIGDVNYLSAGTIITLEDAPVIRNGSTYVPLNFFKEVLNIKVVNDINNYIVINSGKFMTE